MSSRTPSKTCKLPKIENKILFICGLDNFDILIRFSKEVYVLFHQKVKDHCSQWKKKIKATKKIKYSINCEKHEITKALRNPQEKFNVAQFGVAMSLTPFGNPVV